MHALSLCSQPRADLHAFYQGWLDKLTALQATTIIGRFMQVENAEQAATSRVAPHRCREIDGIVARLRLAAAKEKQMARQVAINLSTKALQQEKQQLIERL